jgi:hypothetical protein
MRQLESMRDVAHLRAALENLTCSIERLGVYEKMLTDFSMIFDGIRCCFTTHTIAPNCKFTFTLKG